MAEEDRKQSLEEEAESEIKVNDRRLFNLDGEIRDEARERHEQEEEEAQETASRDDAATSSAEAPSRQEGGPGFEHRPVREPAEVDFTMLINGMAQPALLFLGEIVPPGSEGPRIDLEQARLQIDMLELLKVKCRGNLSAEEDGLLDRILYQLRMLYVARSSGPQP